MVELSDVIFVEKYEINCVMKIYAIVHIVVYSL
jgi:hypothetical protein